MLLTQARFAARFGAHGELIPLDRQDRGLWDRRLIAEGVELVGRALSRGAVGQYQLLAAIAAVHDEADSTESTDWAQIVALYSVLRRITDNPLVSLNQGRVRDCGRSRSWRRECCAITIGYTPCAATYWNWRERWPAR